MKKGIAVPYIIAIFLGVGVIGLLGYWFYVSGGKLNVSVTEQSCRSDFSKWCSDWSLNNYDLNRMPGDRTFLAQNVPCQSFKDKLGTGIIDTNNAEQHKIACGAPPTPS
ncbi:MAG: hypothetical protein QXD72_01150 [Candidatus Aenigmatarchaeota archaeon]